MKNVKLMFLATIGFFSSLNAIMVLPLQKPMSQAAKNEFQFMTWLIKNNYQSSLISSLVLSLADQTPNLNGVTMKVVDEQQFGSDTIPASTWLAHIVLDFYKCGKNNACLAKTYALPSNDNFTLADLQIFISYAAGNTIPASLQQTLEIADPIFTYLMNDPKNSFPSYLKNNQTPLTKMMRSVGWNSGTGGSGTQLGTISQKAKSLGIVTS